MTVAVELVKTSRGEHPNYDVIDISQDGVHSKLGEIAWHYEDEWDAEESYKTGYVFEPKPNELTLDQLTRIVKVFESLVKIVEG